MTDIEIRICSLTFGNCWINPPRIEKTKYLASNKPHGTSADDK